MRIVILGSGAVATHLALALHKVSHQIVQVFSRNLIHAENLAHQINAVAIDDIEKLCADADIYIVSVKDDAISSLVASLPHQNGIWVHTAGSVSMQVLQKHTQNIGVFYPLQTFSKVKAVNFKEIPICIEAAQDQDLTHIRYLAESISDKVFDINEHQRKILHVSAVFSCNFVNFMFAVSQEILEENEIPFEIIRPLIIETAEKVNVHLPKTVQTGPAVRNDQKTIQHHIDFLRNTPQFLEIYKNLSQQIAEMYK